MKTVKCEVCNGERYELREMALEVAFRTGRITPVSTFRYWRARCGVEPDKDGKYGDEELNFLVGLSNWLSANRRNTINQFLEVYFHGNQRQRESSNQGHCAA